MIKAETKRKKAKLPKVLPYYSQRHFAELEFSFFKHVPLPPTWLLKIWYSISFQFSFNVILNFASKKGFLKQKCKEKSKILHSTTSKTSRLLRIPFQGSGKLHE